MSTDIDRVEEFLSRAKERYTVYELFEILDISLDDFIDENWERLLESEELQKELGVTV